MNSTVHLYLWHDNVQGDVSRIQEIQDWLAEHGLKPSIMPPDADVEKPGEYKYIRQMPHGWFMQVCLPDPLAIFAKLTWGGVDHVVV